MVFLVRSLLFNEERAVDGIHRDSSMSLSRFLKSKAFQAPYFHAVSMFRPERLQHRSQPFRAADFLESFSPVEHALVSALVFMHRMAARRADAALMKEVTEYLQRALNLGWFVGTALQPVGREIGMLVGSVRWLGLLPLVRHDKEGLATYLKRLECSEDGITDARYETEVWGCASIQTALILLQRFGFSSQRLTPLMRALTTTSCLSSIEPVEKAYRVAEVWIRYMLESGTTPSLPLEPAYYLAVEHISDIAERVLRGSDSPTFNWLSALPGDLTPEATPQLFCGGACACDSRELRVPEEGLSDTLEGER
jgi:hypothetical protein